MRMGESRVDESTTGKIGPVDMSPIVQPRIGGKFCESLQTREPGVVVQRSLGTPLQSIATTKLDKAIILESGPV